MRPPELRGAHKVAYAALPGFFSFYENDLHTRYGNAARAMVSVLEQVLEQAPPQEHVMLMEWYTPLRVTFSLCRDIDSEEWAIRYRSNELPARLPIGRSLHIDFCTPRRGRSFPAAMFNMLQVSR
jgi:hypothetical protein